ncbi:MAG: class I SAM-dependent methyltransferase [bacterium]|nr:class I SAM-dependent methyltransferase [bacterium]
MSNIKTKPGYGDFGNLSKQYAKHRTGYPDEVIKYFWENIKVNNPLILDVGCGTGIPTRQILRDGAKIIGIDKDPKMIEEAKKVSSDIEYTVALANALPFADESFDAATSFSAFHWFVDDASVNEIKRILKPNAIYFVANKREQKGLKTEFRSIVTNFVGELPNFRNDYKAKAILERNGFSKVESREFDAVESFTVDHANQYAQTMSLLNLVPENQKEVVLAKFNIYCKNNAVDNIIESKAKVIVILGIK